ncbi:MAG: bifunctional [glutamate--ammonia ligase]-adenylyl-L-tyrosine phosphorylase/[glutamate--ammonia-ligase] adenylyltransferase [Gammaproteobacteria bacterium]
MRVPIPDQVLPQFRHDFETILQCLNNDDRLVPHQDEIFEVWYASPFIKRVCISQPTWLQNLLLNNDLHVDRQAKSYAEKIDAEISQAQNIEELQRLLRRFRAAEFARIAWRDIQNYSSVEQTLNELSEFAEIIIDRTLSWCFARLKSQAHLSEFEQSLPQQVVIFALGKLGGRELNFSSDVDLVFAYDDDLSYSQDQQTKAVGIYLKLVQLLIKTLAEQTQDGFVFRVDTRLRPFGESGALLPSLSAIDQYFQTHGRDWERYAWVKARSIAGNKHLGEQFLKEVTPFIYRRYFDYGAAHSLREMKVLVDQKARQKLSEENLKIGFGGIREIEFIVQMFQLIYGGRDAILQCKATLESLKRLVKLNYLSDENVTRLNEAYIFLRKAENGLQIREDQQIHVLPKNEDEKKRYAFLMGYASWDDFYAVYRQHTSNVNNEFQKLLQEDSTKNDTSDDSDFENLWQQIQDQDYCMEILNKNLNGDLEQVYTRLYSFSISGIVKQLVPVARQRLDRFIPIMLSHIVDMEKPLLVLARFLKILNKIVQRSTYISLLTENQSKLSKLFHLIEASPWIAQYIATHPLLLDELLQMESSYEPPSLEEIRQLQEVATQISNGDLEKYMESLREFKHAQTLQIAAADIIEALPIMRVSDHLSWLAEVCIESAVKKAYQDLLRKHGEPMCINEKGTFKPELLIVEYGKLGGLELGYGSDLDLVFLHDSVGNSCETNGEKKLRNEIFFTRLVQRTIHILSTVTSAGKVFDVDVRLRPYGESGPIVSNIISYEKYLTNEAWLWECQALIRARPVTNSQKLINEFERIRQSVLCQPREINEVRNSILEMREKILLEHGSKDKTKFNIKKDKGGIVDIEFIVQFLVLSYANKYNEICRYTDNIRILDACSRVNLIKIETAKELQEIYLLYRKHLHQLSLQMLSESVGVSEFANERLAIQNYWASLLH